MFCGISAFRTAAEKIGGFEFVGYCDNDPTAIAAYQKLYNTEGEIFYDDARTIRTDEIPDFNLLVGGFPCQPFSAAGRRLSFEDERGDLFFELTRILEAKRPEFFVFENVPPIRTIQQGEVFTAILNEISRLGYLCEWQCIDGSSFLPQSRKRVFIVGYTDQRCAGEILPIERKSGEAVSRLNGAMPQGYRVYDVNGTSQTLTALGGGMGAKTGLYLVDMNNNSQFTDEARCITGRQDSGISKRRGEHSGVFAEDGIYPVINPNKEIVRQKGPRVRKEGDPAFCLTVTDRHGIIHRGRVRRLIPQECFRLMGFDDEQFFKLKNELKLSDTKLYKLAGNSIIVPILVEILGRIKTVNEKYVITERTERSENA